MPALKRLLHRATDVALATLVFVGLTLCTAADVRSAEFALMGTGNLAVVGVIDVGDDTTLRAILRRDPTIRTIIIDSPGGDLSVAMRMADIVWSYDLDTVALRALSGGAYIWIAGNGRFVSTGEVATHGIWFVDENNEQITDEQFINDRLTWLTPILMEFWYKFAPEEAFQLTAASTHDPDVWYQMNHLTRQRSTNR